MKREPYTVRNMLVMLVEDHEDTLELYSEFCRFSGTDVVGEVTPQNAFERAVEVQPDVIVTDYRMAPVDGLELCRRLRAHPTTSRTPLIMLTGHTAAADLDLFRTVCNAVLLKPCPPAELFRHVREVVGDPAPRPRQ